MRISIVCFTVFMVLAPVWANAQLDVRTVVVDDIYKIQLGIYEAGKLDSMARASKILLTQQHYAQELTDQILGTLTLERRKCAEILRQRLDLQNMVAAVSAELRLCRRDYDALKDRAFALEGENLKLEKDVRKYKAQSSSTRTFTKILVAVVAVLAVNQFAASQ